MLYKGFICTLAAGLAWAIPLPALYILNSLSGSRLAASSTLLAALVTVSWGGLAMIASIPINWFFTATVPHPAFVLLVNLIVFTGVGVSMIDVFRRVMQRLEPRAQVRAGVVADARRGDRRGVVLLLRVVPVCAISCVIRAPARDYRMTHLHYIIIATRKD